MAKPKRPRRTKAEIEAYLAKHSGKRKVTAEEMQVFLDMRARRKRVVGGAAVASSVNNKTKVSSQQYQGGRHQQLQRGLSSSSCLPLFNQTTILHVFPALRKREYEIWRGVCKILNCYDLEGLQDWLFENCAPHMRLRFVDSGIPAIFGPKALALYFCAGLGTFPVYNAHGERILELDLATHSALLDEAKCSSSLLENNLNLENTICYQFATQFEGVRIYYQDLWHIIGHYVAKHPEMHCLGSASDLSLKGTEVHDMLLGVDEVGIYADLHRIPPSDLRVRNEGMTVVEVKFNILADFSSGAVVFCTIQVFTQLCPPLDAIKAERE